MKNKRPQPAATPEQAIKQKKNRLQDKRDLLSCLKTIVLFALCAFVLFFCVFRILPVSGQDMAPALKNGDLEVVFSLSDTYKNNDVVVYQEDGQYRTGRIIALPGDSVQITSDEQVMVNNALLTESYIFCSTPAYDSGVSYPVTLNDGEYFILADNRQDAMDSRYYGPVNKEQIVGQVVLAIRSADL